MNKLKNVNYLEIGDVLLCNTNTKYIAKEIKDTTNGYYSHAAIYLGDGKIGESTVVTGVKISEVDKLIIDSNFIAILRSPDAWKSSKNIQTLKDFVKNKAQIFSNYNLKGILDLKQDKTLINGTRQNDLIVTQELEKYFINKTEWEENKNVFCSEFVMECFYKIGFFDHSMQAPYNPKRTSPNDIARDNLCGIFAGYITNNLDNIPKDDIFYYKSLYEDIFV